MKIFILANLILSPLASAQIIYPQTKKITQIETRFGTVIEDSYKWMENSSDPDLWSWIEEQKTITDNYLDASLMEVFASSALSYRKIVTEQNARTTNVAPNPSMDHFAIPSIHNKKTTRLIRWQSSKKNKNQVFIKESATYEIQTKQVANGDLTRVIVTKKEDNKLVDILNVKFYSFITWADDNSFYYTSDMDERLGGGRPGLFKHTVGEIQSEDKLLLAAKTPSSDFDVHQLGNAFYIQVDDVIGSLQLATGKVTNTHKINGSIVEINDAPEFVATILNFKNANYGEFHKLRLRDGARSVFVPEQNFVLEKSKRLNNEKTLIIGIKDSSHVAGIFDGTNIKMLDLQDGSIAFNLKNDELNLTHETYSTPKKLYSVDVNSGELKLLLAQEFPIEIEAKKIHYTAANGQVASLWLMHKKGLSLNTTTPTILYGYGGFRVPITPAFGMYESLAWMEKGGAFAVVTLPGSLDYGESWYQLARVGNRINAWDSFALAAKELFKQGLTSPAHIGIMGASNGGTLTAGTLERHSDVFKAAVPIVGVMDLLNFTLFTAGKYWTEDYGNPFNEKDFKAIFPLSPYHNITKKDYPATMVMTAEFDDRVVPMHSYKYLARLQENNTSSAPMLLYNKEWGSHARSSGSARESSRFVAAFYTFFAQQLGN